MSLSFVLADGKFGYVDYDKIMKQSNELQEAKRIFDSEAGAWKKEIEDMQQDLQEDATRLQSQGMMYSEEKKKKLALALQAKEQEVAQKYEEYFGQSGIAVSRNAELMEPIVKKIHDIVNEIAVDENYDMIFEISTGVIPYAKENLDITNKVIDKLNSEEEENTSTEK